MRNAISVDKFNMSRHYILTQPSRLDDVDLDDLSYTRDESWREKSRKLQVRRWRKLKSLDA